MSYQPIRNLGKGKRLSPNPNLNITNNDKDKIIPVADDLNILGCIKQDKAADANAVGKRKPNFFNEKALTTTIPAQLIKKFNIPVIPIYIERIREINFEITIDKPIYFSKNDTNQIITDRLNKVLESMILKKPEQWIWTHNRWK